MDFAGFCDEAVRVFLLRGRDALFFCLAICCRRAVEVLGASAGGFPGGTYHAVGMNFGKVRESVMTVMVVLVYNSGQGKLNNLYYQMKE